jgi:hypothetical protein
MTLLAAVLVLLAVFIYTLRYAEGLKHNQDKYFVVMSLILYAAALLLSVYFALTLILFVCCEFSRKSNFKTISIKLFYFIIITIFVLLFKNN